MEEKRTDVYDVLCMCGSARHDERRTSIDSILVSRSKGTQSMSTPTENSAVSENASISIAEAIPPADQPNSSPVQGGNNADGSLDRKKPRPWPIV